MVRKRLIAMYATMFLAGVGGSIAVYSFAPEHFKINEAIELQEPIIYFDDSQIKMYDNRIYKDDIKELLSSNDFAVFVQNKEDEGKLHNIGRKLGNSTHINDILGGATLNQESVTGMPVEEVYDYLKAKDLDYETDESFFIGSRVKHIHPEPRTSLTIGKAGNLDEQMDVIKEDTRYRYFIIAGIIDGKSEIVGIYLEEYGVAKEYALVKTLIESMHEDPIDIRSVDYFEK